MRKNVLYILWMTVFVTSLFSCTEDIDESARYVFNDPTVIDYLKKHSDTYSTYLDLLYRVPVNPVSKTSVGQLLSARGNYTVFAPTNEAVQAYLDSLYVKEEVRCYMKAPSWDAFTDSIKLDSIRAVVVLNSIIDGGDNGGAYSTQDFPTLSGGEFGLGTLNDHKLSVYYSDVPEEVLINKDCPMNVRNRDIIVLNGYVHQMEKVIAPHDFSAAQYFQEILNQQKDGYLTMARCLQACGLMDTLSAIRDEVYETMYQDGLIKGWQSHDYFCQAPRHRLYGFTIFAETDDFWRSEGIDPKDPDLMSKLQQWLLDNKQYASDDTFTTGKDYGNEENLLNQWITYHILPMRLAADKLVIHHNEVGFTLENPYVLGNPVAEYYAVYGKPRLIKFYESQQSNGVRINRFPVLDNKRRGTGKELRCDMDKEGILIGREDDTAVLSEIANCCIYPIHEPLYYSDETKTFLQRERIRFDVMAMCPEFMTNDIRKQVLPSWGLSDDDFYYMPQTQTYTYSPNLFLGDETHFRYNNFYGAAVDNFQADELLVYGRYDITLKIPPIPRSGTYELRMGYLAMEGRGIAQCYFGNNPDELYVTGIPLNMELNGEAPISGWEADSEDDDYNAEVDKRMHTNGFMKGPLSICPMGASPSTGARYDMQSIRRIIVRTTMQPDKNYYLRLKSVLESRTKGLIIDYFEIVSKEVYDNPNEPEDIW